MLRCCFLSDFVGCVFGPPPLGIRGKRRKKKGRTERASQKSNKQVGKKGGGGRSERPPSCNSTNVASGWARRLDCNSRTEKKGPELASCTTYYLPVYCASTLGGLSFFGGLSHNDEEKDLPAV